MIDRAKAEMIRRQAPQLIGLHKTVAIDACVMAGIVPRITVEDGCGMMKTNDVRMDRINMSVENGVVISVGVG